MKRDYVTQIFDAAVSAVEYYPSIRQIQLEVCGKYNIELSELLSKRRLRRLAIPRQEAYWRASRETRLSYPQIGRAFDRDHGTVIYGVRKHEQRMGATNGSNGR